MMKKITNDAYEVNDNVIVVNKEHPFYNKSGNVARFGEAGDVKYIIVKLDGINTLITFNESDLMHEK